MDVINKIKDILEPVAKDYDINIIQVLFSHNILQILIEKDNYITASIDDCERVSKAFSAILDVEDILKGKYFLEVSSAGMDRPLLKIEDYEYFKDRYVKLELLKKIENIKILKGYIENVVDDVVVLKFKCADDNKLININFKDILKARLLITDDILKQIFKETKKKGRSKNV